MVKRSVKLCFGLLRAFSAFHERSDDTAAAVEHFVNVPVPLHRVSMHKLVVQAPKQPMSFATKESAKAPGALHKLITGGYLAGGLRALELGAGPLFC